MDDATVRYGQTALDNACAVIATAQAGIRNQVLNTEAFGIGQLVAAGCLDLSAVERALMTAALECGEDRKKAEATIGSGLQAGMRQPRQLPEKKKTAMRRLRLRFIGKPGRRRISPASCIVTPARSLEH